jgi:hypothetical protein
MSAARPGKNFSEMKCPAPVARNLINNGEFVESLSWVPLTEQKAATAGQGEAVTASPSTKPPMSPCGPVPRPIPAGKKPPLPTKIVTDYG